MAKKFKFEFERGGILIADACEKEAPVTVKLFEEQCPRTMTLMHCVSACHEITTDDIPSSAPIPEENLVHFGEIGDVATVSGNQSVTLTGLEQIGYTTLCFVYGPHQRFQGTKIQTNRATVFARLHKDLELLREIGHRMHIHGNETVTMTCYDE
ncbi:MAG: DUF3830 family protein [Clostridium sp.]|nr:DUF3830 family protein [Clostridium sp.]